MKVYLDNNILVDIEDGKYQLQEFISEPQDDYFYSDAHLSELLEAIDNPRVSQVERLNTISKLCGYNFIVTGVWGPPEFLQRMPTDMFKLADTPLRNSIKMMALRGTSIFEKIRIDLGFDSKIFNNEKPESVLRILDSRMNEKLGIGLKEYLVRSEALGGRPLFYTLLNIIDAANYWGDVKTDHSEVAKLYDASHAYFAQICDVLVTDDKRMRAKVKAIYSFLKIDTKVVSPKEFFRIKKG